MQETTQAKYLKLNIYQTFRQAFSLYIRNFKLFITFSFLLFMLGIGYSLLIYDAGLTNNLTQGIIFLSFIFVAIFPYMYYAMLWMSGMLTCIFLRYQNREMGFLTSVTEAKVKMFGNLRIYLMLGLLIGVPAGISFIQMNTTVVLPSYVLSGLFIFIAVILATVFWCSNQFKIDDDAVLVNNMKIMVKGNFINLVALTIIILIISLLPLESVMIFTGGIPQSNDLNTLIYQIFACIYGMFISPLLLSVCVIAYHNLRNAD